MYPTFRDAARAQSQSVGIKTDRAVYPEPPLPPLPAKGGKYTDPVFGTEIMRATDATDQASLGCGTFYNQWPTFNADNTRLLIRCGIDGDVVFKTFDPVNFTLGQTLRRSPLLPGGVSVTWQGATWSRTDPDLIFVHVNYYDASYPQTGMKLYGYRLSTNTFTLVKDFAPQLSPGNPDYLWEMHVANDDIFTFLHKRVGLSEPIKIIIWKRSTDTVLQHLAVNDPHLPLQGANAALPDKSGRWIFFPSNGVPVAGEMRIAILDLSNNSWQSIYWVGADDSPSHGDLGTGTLVGHGQFSGAATIRSLTNVHNVTRLFDYKDAKGITDWSNDQHTSMYADDENWAMMSLYDEGDVFETGAFENEVMQFSTSNPNSFRRLFHHRSQIDNLTPTSGYWALPKATISRDGRFIAYTSNWENSGRYDLFIAKIDPPSSTSSPTPSPTPTSTPAAPTNSATFVQVDTTTKGNWKDSFGGEGYNTINDTLVYPTYAQVDATTYSTSAWTMSTTDLRALEKMSGTDRVAARWESSSFFSIDVNLTDGLTHRVALYVLDWDGNNRSERIDIVDQTTNTLLDSRSVDSFNGGKYLVWDVRGHVKITVNNVGPKTAVVSGLYFGGPSSVPTPTPTPTPTPSPTPSITVKVTSPATNSTFAVGSNVTLTATASKQNGVISNVTFNANGQTIGTSNVSPYSTVWASPAAGTYSVTAVARDDIGQSVTSAPITVKISKALKSVRNGKGSASTIGSSLISGSPSSENGPLNNLDQMNALVANLEQAYVDFTSERIMFTATARDIDRYLYAALYLAKSSLSLSEQSTPTSGVSDRLTKINSYLSFCEDLMTDGVISNRTLNTATKTNARTDISIKQSDVLPLGTNGVNLMQGNTGAITSPISDPLTSAVEVATNTGSYELGGVSVSVGGQAVPMISVSPTAITFYVPSDLPGGLADVVVTARDGFISHTTASVNGLNPTILVWQGEGNTAGAIFNALGLNRDGLSAYTSWWLGSDTQTRLSILATGLSTGLTNTNVSNDVFLANGKLVENYAEVVQVEVRTSDNRTFMLPVEFAGANDTLRGLDQVTVRLSPQLAGAGSVQLTVIAGGRRSNVSVVTIN